MNGLQAKCCLVKGRGFPIGKLRFFWLFAGRRICFAEENLPAEMLFVLPITFVLLSFPWRKTIPSMPKVTRSTIGPLHEKITVQLSKEDYLYTFEKQLKKLGQSLRLPGFPAGQAPAGLVRKVYGQTLFEKLVTEQAEGLMTAYLTNLKLNIILRPLRLSEPETIDIAHPGSYTFEYEIGLRPRLRLSLPDKSVELTRYQILVSEERLQEELEEALGMQAAPAEIPQAEDENAILYLTGRPEKYAGWSLEQLDEKWNFPIVADLPKRLREQAAGKRAGDTLSLNPARDLPDAYLRQHYLEAILEAEAEDEEDGEYELHVLKVARKVHPPLSEAVFKNHFPEQSITTEEAFLEALRHNLQKVLADISEAHFEEALLAKWFEQNPLELPVDFLKRAILDDDQYQEEGLRALAEFEGQQSNFATDLYEGLLFDEAEKALDITVSEADIRAASQAHIEQLLFSHGISESDSEMEELIDRRLKHENARQEAVRVVRRKKILAHLKTLVTIQEKEVDDKAFFALYPVRISANAGPAQAAPDEDSLENG